MKEECIFTLPEVFWEGCVVVGSSRVPGAIVDCIDPGKLHALIGNAILI
jgi:hypothetical protein